MMKETLQTKITESGLPIAEITRRAGIKTPQTIYNYLSGKSCISCDSYEKIIDVIDGTKKAAE